MRQRSGMSLELSQLGRFADRALGAIDESGARDIWTTPDGPLPLGDENAPLVESRTTDPLNYEPLRVRINGAGIASMNCGLLAFFFFAALGPPWRYPAITLAVVAAPWAVRRAFRTSLVVTVAGVTLNNYWKTHTLAWSEVRGVGSG